MSDPTIDDCVEWVRSVANYPPIKPVQDAICAILEKHREPFAEPTIKEAMGHMKAIKLEAIRAFVERVEKRMERDGKGYEDAYAYAVEAELAALESEVKE
jgi:hypothetical protein